MTDDARFIIKAQSNLNYPVCSVILNNYFHERALDMRWQIANEAPITNLTSNKREWNNCFIKFSTLVYLEIIAALDFNFTKRPEVDVAKKQRQVGNHMTCAAFVNLVE